MTIAKNILTVFMMPLILWASFLSTGCMSGGFKYTRQFAAFINKQELIVRIILYIFIGLAFVVTFLLDTVIFNTIDFWEGSLSAGVYNFRDGNTLYAVNHFYSGKEGNLRNTKIEVFQESSNGKKELSKTVLITEVAGNHVQIYKGGKLLAEADNIYSLPLITRYDDNGNIQEKFLALMPQTMTAKR